jgi:hypothetical protein
MGSNGILGCKFLPENAHRAIVHTFFAIAG